MKKTTLKITLAFILSLCSLTACGNSSESDKKSDKKESVTTTAVSEETTAEADTTAAEEDTTAAEATTENGSASTPAAGEGTNFKRGTVEGNVYTSEFGGFKLTAPDDWKFATDEQILQVMNIGANAVYSEKADAALEIANQATISDAICMNSSSTENITISYENLAKNVALPDDASAEDYFAIADRQFALIPSMKYTKVSGPENTTLGGNEYLRAVYDVDYGNITLKQAYYVRRVEDFINVISVTSYAPDKDILSYEELFSAID